MYSVKKSQSFTFLQQNWATSDPAIYTCYPNLKDISQYCSKSDRSGYIYIYIYIYMYICKFELVYMLWENEIERDV